MTESDITSFRAKRALEILCDATYNEDPERWFLLDRPVGDYWPRFLAQCGQNERDAVRDFIQRVREVAETFDYARRQPRIAAAFEAEAARP